MNHNDRARLLRHRQRVTLQEAAYLIIERLGGGWADAVSLLAEAAELKRLPADVKPLLATWTNTAIAPVDPEKSTVLTADLLAWLDTVGALPLRNEQDLGARVEAGYLLGDAYPNDGPAITLGADSGAKTGKLDAAEKHKNRHLAVIECANGAMFSVAGWTRGPSRTNSIFRSKACLPSQIGLATTPPTITTSHMKFCRTRWRGTSSPRAPARMTPDCNSRPRMTLPSHRIRFPGSETS